MTDEVLLRETKFSNLPLFKALDGKSEGSKEGEGGEKEKSGPQTSSLQSFLRLELKMMLLNEFCSPPKFIFEVLAPSTSGQTIFRNGVFKEVIKF